jgi:RimJ/RimL family protein N-acetyltransferase
MQSAEIGPVIILKSAQRSHVTTNSIGLLMHYALNLPSDATMPGLGLRRVQWMCHSENARSLATARRLGFQMEGTLRWLIVCAEGSSFGDKPRVGDPVQKRGRHDLILSMCWDQWSSEGRAIVERQMARCL